MFSVNKTYCEYSTKIIFLQQDMLLNLNGTLVSHVYP